MLLLCGRAKAYAESRAAAERNKRLVAEQEGLYYPSAPADVPMFRCCASLQHGPAVPHSALPAHACALPGKGKLLS